MVANQGIPGPRKHYSCRFVEKSLESQAAHYPIACSQGDWSPELHDNPQDRCNGEEQ
jgi:hypothetical protein